MEEQKKLFLIFSLIFVLLGILFTISSIKNDGLLFVACNIGQGDGMLIQSQSKQVVVDGGPGTKIADCLSANMPFWDRTVDMIVLTHPQKDHMEGLIEVLNRYEVKSIVATGLTNESDIYKVWEDTIKKEGAKVYQPKAGDKFVLDSKRGQSSFLEVLWPTEGAVLGWKSTQISDLNESSIVMRLQFNNDCAYLTGDIPLEILEKVIDRQCKILKVSHHGSKTGTSELVLERAKPKIAIIQVGKNSYGHPNDFVLDLLNKNGIRILRNDTNGVIKVDVDSRGWQIKTEK